MRPALYRLLLALAYATLTTGAVGADPPELRSVDPPGAQRGVETTLQILGQNLAGELQLVLPFPAEVSGGANSSEVASFSIRPAPETPAGLYPLRVLTADGVSNLLLFAVDDLVQVAEVEPNGAPQQAQPIEWPVTINGSIGGRGAPHPSQDVDCYRFSVQAGQRLTIVSETRRLGLTPDLLVRLRGPGGEELAYSDDELGLGVDPRLDYTFRESGEYTIEAHLTHFDYHGRNFCYRLRIGPFDYARAVYPLGGRRGEKVQLSVVGRDGQGTQVEAQVPPDPWADDWLLPLQDFPGSLPWRLAIGDLPELMEDPEQVEPIVAWPVTINGRIDRPEQADRYRLTVQPGQSVRVNVEAFYYGSALDGQLLVYDPSGALIAENNDRGGRIDIDPGLEFTVPEAVHEVTIAIADCFGRGGIEYGYRMAIEPGGPDFAVQLGAEFPTSLDSDALNLRIGQPVKVPIRAQRKGYDGAIRLTALDVPPGVTVEPSEIAAGETVGELTVTGSAEAPCALFEIGLVGEATVNGETIRRKAVRPIHLAEPYFTNLPWNWRLTRLVCAAVRGK